MKLSLGSRIEFARTDPRRNVARYYRLEVGSHQLSLSFESSGHLVITRAWGRLGQPPKEKTERFPSWAALAEAWEQQKARRLARGYRITRESDRSTSSISPPESAIR